MFGKTNCSHIVATHHEGVAQHQRIMHGDTRWNKHQPSLRQHADAAPPERSQQRTGERCYGCCDRRLDV
ncbi:MAG: hypothetical protein EB005_06880 [Actinobacteria bacterium]|nr:hypothetical protein [Actinomycetota bacterium]